MNWTREAAEHWAEGIRKHNQIRMSVLKAEAAWMNLKLGRFEPATIPVRMVHSKNSRRAQPIIYLFAEALPKLNGSEFDTHDLKRIVLEDNPEKAQAIKHSARWMLNALGTRGLIEKVGFGRWRVVQ